MYIFNNHIIYLIGFPGTGKYTIAKEIAKKANFKVIDNHLINNPILSVLEIDRKTKVPSEIWEKIASVKEIVFDTILNYSVENANFIFTNHLVEGEISSSESYNKIVNLAEKRNSLFIPIKLICAVDELKKRIILRDRFERLKLCDEKSIIKIATQYQVFQPPNLHCFELDVSNLTPSQASDLIRSKVRDLRN